MPDKFPRALSFLQAMPKASIIDYLAHSHIGRRALAELEAKLNRGRDGPEKEIFK